MAFPCLMVSSPTRHRGPLIRFLLVVTLALQGAQTLAIEKIEPRFFVMRHLDKEKIASQDDKDTPLSSSGCLMSYALADWAASSNIRSIFVTEYKRTQQTAYQPSLRLQKDGKALRPEMYKKSLDDDAINRIKAAQGPVLVVAHSDTVPLIVSRLGRAPLKDLRGSPVKEVKGFGEIWAVPGIGSTKIAIPKNTTISPYCGN